MRIFLYILMLMCALNLSVQAQNSIDDKKAAGEIADKLFAAMKAKNYEQIKSLFLDGGKLTALDQPKTGKGISTTRNFTGDAFAKMISEAKAPEFIEKMPTKDVRIYGDSAVVIGRYTFHVGEKFSHCGINAFHLLKSNGEWKIANASTTIEPKNCETTKDFSAENKDALGAVNNLFDLMAAHKPAEIITMHTPESQLTALIVGRDGKSKIENLSREAFSKFFEKKTAELAEKMYEEKIKVDGDLATVDGRYVFTVNGKLQHCGMNSFHLIRTADGWKLGNSISTIEPNGCTEKEKAMVK
jgi:hypothetical protein